MATAFRRHWRFSSRRWSAKTMTIFRQASRLTALGSGRSAATKESVKESPCKAEGAPRDWSRKLRPETRSPEPQPCNPKPKPHKDQPSKALREQEVDRTAFHKCSQSRTEGTPPRSRNRSSSGKDKTVSAEAGLHQHCQACWCKSLWTCSLKTQLCMDVLPLT